MDSLVLYFYSLTNNNNMNNMRNMSKPKELTRAEILRAATTFRWTKKMPKWRVVVNSRELPARPLVLEAAGVRPNDPTNSHQAVAILENLGFETRYALENQGATTEHERQKEELENTESMTSIFSRIAETVPQSEWAKLPSDLSKNLDHYLYGNKKIK
jgi:hypothetical protein